MKAMVLNAITDLLGNREPLVSTDMPVPEPGEGEVLIRLSACGVCHTELDEIEGRTPPSRFPLILGHEAVGRVVKTGPAVQKLGEGDRVGVGWIYDACGHCAFCRSGLENLCEDFRATGRDVHGGYAEYMVAPELSAFPVPGIFSDTEAAPFLCAGAIGFRSLRLADISDGQRLGLTGFGASGHLVLKMAREQYPRSDIYVFARSEKEREFAVELGAVWAGDNTDTAPEKCHAIIDTTPVWKPVVHALANLEKGGRLVINAIRKEDTDKSVMAQLDYPSHLWLEKEIKSVANVARADIQGFLDLAARIPIRPAVQTYALDQANEVLYELKTGKIRGAKVLVM